MNDVNASQRRLSQQPNAITNQPKKDNSNVTPTDASYYTRHYGWDEIEQHEEYNKRLHELIASWDAERIAILKIQQDLDKNILQRTIDYFKRIGQSMGLALWLWVHRPANCSHYPQRQQPSSNYQYVSSNDPSREIDLLETLPDSRWLKHFVLDDPAETVPPIARAMKSMLDRNVLIWNADSQKEIVWPHFINQQRTKKDKRFLRQLNEHNLNKAQLSDADRPPSTDLVREKTVKPLTTLLSKSKKNKRTEPKTTDRSKSKSKSKKTKKH